MAERAQLTTDTDLELLEQEMADNPTYCESGMHQRRGLGWHSAQWWASAPCGDITAICERRRQEFYDAHSWMCTPGCDEKHYVDDVTFTPVVN